MNDLKINSIDEIKTMPISNLYVEIFGEQKWDSLSDEYYSVRKAVMKIKRKRDKLNNKNKKSVKKRNENNIKVSKLKEKVKQIKEIRNSENESVKKLKKERLDLQKSLNDIREKVKNNVGEDEVLNARLEKIINQHNDKHNQVILAVNDAQASHEEMVKLGDIMTEKRNLAQTHHEDAKNIKKQSDLYHHLFIRFLDYQNELQKFIRYEEEE